MIAYLFQNSWRLSVGLLCVVHIHLPYHASRVLSAHRCWYCYLPELALQASYHLLQTFSALCLNCSTWTVMLVIGLMLHWCYWGVCSMVMNLLGNIFPQQPPRSCVPGNMYFHLHVVVLVYQETQSIIFKHKTISNRSKQGISTIMNSWQLRTEARNLISTFKMYIKNIKSSNTS